MFEGKMWGLLGGEGLLNRRIALQAPNARRDQRIILLGWRIPYSAMTLEPSTR